MNNKKKGSVVENSIKTLHQNLEFTASEQYRLLRTNIMFTLPEKTKCPVIGVTSSTRGEGKSTTSVNLAYVLAENGAKVLLIDGDLRIPSIAKKMRIAGSPGLTNLLMGNKADMVNWRSNINQNWYILPAGDIPPNPSELLGSKRMESLLRQLRELFDYIILDLPPVNLVSDAISVSGYINGMVLVVRENYASKKDVDTCIRQLKLSNVNVLGCVMNGDDAGGGSYKKYNYKYKAYNSDD